MCDAGPSQFPGAWLQGVGVKSIEIAPDRAEAGAPGRSNRYLWPSRLHGRNP